jgi:hypothetical protein
MARYALVKDGKVVNVILWDGLTAFNADGTLVEITDEVGPGWTYNGVTFMPPPVDTVALARNEAHGVVDIRLRQAYVTLQSWAADTRSTTVTSGNAVQVLQQMVTRFGVLLERFADVLETQGRKG